MLVIYAVSILVGSLMWLGSAFFERGSPWNNRLFGAGALLYSAAITAGLLWLLTQG